MHLDILNKMIAKRRALRHASFASQPLLRAAYLLDPKAKLIAQQQENYNGKTEKSAVY
jgi:hypothetical protein